MPNPYFVELNLPAGDRLTLFLEHFRALLPELLTQYSGQGGRDPASKFQFRLLSGPVALPDGRTQETKITFAFMPDGSLPNLTVLAVPPLLDEQAWFTKVSSFFTRVLASALTDRKTRFTRRVVLQYVGQALDGEYWLGGVRVAPADPNDQDRAVFNFERAVAIDSEVEAIDSSAADAIASYKASRLATLLSMLTDVAFYRPGSEALWVWPSQSPKPLRAHLGYQFHPSELPAMPGKGVLCQPGKSACSIFDTYCWVDNTLMLPRESRTIVRAINSLNANASDRTAAESAARLIHIALRLQSISVSASLAYRVAATEALAGHLQPPRKFSPFMREWVPAYPGLESDLDLLYGQVRSGHVHAGMFLAREYEESGFANSFLDPEEDQKYEIMAKVRHLTRLAIGKWLLSLPDPARRSGQQPT